MPSFLDTYNLSILAIPAYYVLSLIPHNMALTAATRGQITKWDNRNPRSTTMKENLRKRLGPEEYARYERLEACHANGMENLPLFATAVVLGNMAGLKDEMTSFAGWFLAVRAMFTIVYAMGKTQGVTLARTGLFMTGTLLCMRIIVKAAKALGP